MHTYPYQLFAHEPTKKQLWIASMVSLLCHMSPEDAVAAADRALALCDKRWQDPAFVRTWQYEHNYPVGHTFVDINAVDSDSSAT